MTSVHFTMAHASIFLAALLPLVATGIAKIGTLGLPPQQGGYDNHHPRDWLARQVGWRARANAAQANSFEALPFFIGAVLAALQLGAPQGWLDALTLTFIVLRLGFIVAYVRDWASVRSTFWLLAFVVNIAILFLGWR